MESLISEPGRNNPLLFLSLSIVNRIPGYSPSDEEIISQLECMNDLLNSVSSSIFRLESVKSPVAIAVDALITVSQFEAKKPVVARVLALKNLNLLVDKLDASGLDCMIEIIPGILSKMARIATSRVDVEVDNVIKFALEIIEIIVNCFWREQDSEWRKGPGMKDEEFVLLKKKYKDNIDAVICSLKPLIRKDHFHRLLFNIFKAHLNGSDPSPLSIQIYLILASGLPEKKHHFLQPHVYKKLVKIYNDEIVEWFEINSECLNTIHEDTIAQKLQIIMGILAIEQCSNFIIPSDLFTIIKLLTQLRVSIGDTVSIDYSDSVSYGIERALDSSVDSNHIVPEINFKYQLRLSKDVKIMIEKLFAMLIYFDSKCVFDGIISMNSFNCDSTEYVIQKLDLCASYCEYSQFNIVELIKEAMKHYETNITNFDSVEKHQLIHLASLKLLWNAYSKTHCLAPVKPFLTVILSGMASDWIILKEVSTQILKGIASSQGANIGEFIKEHEIFLLDRIGIQLSLPSFYPEAPLIISCLVRTILNPDSAINYTDLLVRKVSENLASFQKYPNYCKDLLLVAKETIESVCKNEPMPFIEPEDFAFSKPSEDLNDDEIKEKEERLNSQQRIILDLIRVGLNFITSDSKHIRARSMNLVETAASRFLSPKQSVTREDPSDICQLIHIAWPNMIAAVKASILKDPTQTDVVVVEAFQTCSKVLFEKFPRFMRDRFVKDLWRNCLKKNILFMKTDDSPDFKTSASLKLSDYLLSIVNFGIIYCKPSTDVCLDIVYSLYDCKCFQIFESVHKIEPDVIWYFYSIELGGLSSISCQSDRLKSFKLNSNPKISIDEKLKTRLKQLFIA